MHYPTHSAFSAQLGSAFEVSGGMAALPLVLAAVSPPPGDGASDAPSAFSLVFLGDETLRLNQGMYLFSHPQLGEFELFIVPLGPSRTDPRMQYEAVFN